MDGALQDRILKNKKRRKINNGKIVNRRAPIPLTYEYSIADGLRLATW